MYIYEVRGDVVLFSLQKSLSHVFVVLFTSLEHTPQKNFKITLSRFD